MLALWAVSASWFSCGMAFAPIESAGCCVSLAAVIFPLLTVICTCMGPYWVLTIGPVKVPDGAAGAVLGGGFGAVELGGAELGAGWAGVVFGGALVGVVPDPP